MQQAPKDIRCLDIWPLARLTRIIIRTYRNLDRLGQIAIQYPVRVASGKVAFEYLATVPQEWARQDIRDAADQILRGLEQDRDNLEAQLMAMSDLDPARVEKYNEIIRILEV